MDLWFFGFAENVSWPPKIWSDAHPLGLCGRWLAKERRGCFCRMTSPRGVPDATRTQIHATEPFLRHRISVNTIHVFLKEETKWRSARIGQSR
jgi:hypothetical protein